MKNSKSGKLLLRIRLIIVFVLAMLFTYLMVKFSIFWGFGIVGLTVVVYCITKDDNVLKVFLPALIISFCLINMFEIPDKITSQEEKEKQNLFKLKIKQILLNEYNEKIRIKVNELEIEREKQGKIRTLIYDNELVNQKERELKLLYKYKNKLDKEILKLRGKDYTSTMINKILDKSPNKIDEEILVKYFDEKKVKEFIENDPLLKDYRKEDLLQKFSEKELYELYEKESKSDEVHNIVEESYDKNDVKIKNKTVVDKKIDSKKKKTIKNKSNLFYSCKKCGSNLRYQGRDSDNLSMKLYKCEHCKYIEKISS